MSDALFSPTQAERLETIKAFVNEELLHRARMCERHPERSDYWASRVKQAAVALQHVEALQREQLQ